jgi:hypothetical protein
VGSRYSYGQDAVRGRRRGSQGDRLHARVAHGQGAVQLGKLAQSATWCLQASVDPVSNAPQRRHSCQGTHHRQEVAPRPARHPLGTASLSLGEIADIGLPVLPPDTPLQIREAINAWRRAAEASDPVEAVVALNDAVEFYVSNVRLPKLFTKDQKKSIRENATRGLEGDQKKRVSDVLNDMLNAPSLMMKLRKALEDNKVPHTENEAQLLKKVRDKRNDLVHGRSREAPSEDDVRLRHCVRQPDARV